MVRYGLLNFLFDIVMISLTAGLWLVWIFIREMRQEVTRWRVGVFCGERLWRLSSWRRNPGVHRNSVGFSVGPILVYKR